MAKEHIYKVDGTHCVSCEILIEKKLLEEVSNIKSVDVSSAKGQVVVAYEGDRPNPNRLSKMFAKENYKFSDFVSQEPLAPLGDNKKNSPINSTLIGFNIAIFIIIGFLILQKIGIADFLSISSGSSIATFFGFGVLAGISSCMALVGGLVLSMSKQWQGLYSEQDSVAKRFQPHIIFNAGRVISYAFLGGILGLIGSQLKISFTFTAFLTIGVSFLMIVLGMQMLGVKAFRKFQVTAPKSAILYIANENNFQGKYMPFLMGALTFFLPCGFTITVQGLALLSGNFFQGALMTGAFALGTAPSLLFVGLSSVKFSSKPHLAEKFSKVAGFLVLFFALFNISNQMNVLGFTGFDGLFNQDTQIVSEKDFPPIINGKQVIKMNASARGYSPNYFKVKVGVPVKWEITDTGTSGCTNAVISKSLFEEAIELTKGQVAIKEFTPQKIGKHRFSCWMGMVSGTIEVVN